MRRFRDQYGAEPLHLIATVATLAFCGFVVLEVLDQREPLSFLVFFGAAIVLHDLVAFPLYTLLDRIAQVGVGARRSDPRRVSTINHLRVPALLSGLFGIVWFPLILRLSDVYEGATGRTTDVYLGRWLLLTGCLFGASGLLYAVRLALSARGPPGADGGRRAPPPEDGDGARAPSAT